MLEKVSGLFKQVKAYWNVPPKGRNVPFKEIAAYGVGGMGVHFASALTSTIVLSAGNFIVGASIGIDPMHLQTMNIIALCFGMLVTMLRSYLYDNTKSKMGKFRPWLKWTGLPTVLASILFVWMPYETMTYPQKVVTVQLCFLLLSGFSSFFTDAFHMLIQVMSPDTEERTDIMSITQIIFSFAPTVVNAVIPFLAVYTGGLNDIRTYRIIYPFFTIFGLFLTYFIWHDTNERIIYSKKQERSVRFADAVRSVAKNKYFWITNIATWIGFLESAYLTILNWTFVYAMPEKQQLLGVVNAVIGNGALWAMMAAPFLVRRLGKRNLLIWCNVANIFLLAALLPVFHNIWLVIVICYVNNFISVLGNIYNPGIQADMKDYHQWKTGERIDGMFGVVGMIGTVIGFATGYVQPALYRAFGLNTDYNVLYDATIRNNIFRMLIIASVVGAVLNVLPYLFYDLTEEKHHGMIKVLRIRAMFDDYGNDVLDDDELVESMGVVNRSFELEHSEKVPVPKERLAAARALPKTTPEERAACKQRIAAAKAMPRGTDEEKALRKQALKQAKWTQSAQTRTDEIKKAKALCAEARALNMEIAAAPIVLDEMRKFDTVRFQRQLDEAKRIYAAGIDGLLGEDESRLQEIIRQTSGKTKEEKQIRSDMKDLARTIRTSQRLIRRYYPDGVRKPIPARLEEAENRAASSILETIRKKRDINAALKEKSIYNRSIKPYTAAAELIRQAENYRHLDDLRERYQQVLAEKAASETVPV